jgi:hypothetical protein
MMNVDAFVLDIAARQHGVFTLDQAVEVGMTRAEVHARRRRGIYLALHREVLVVRSSPRTWAQEAVGACAASGWRGALCRGAAASLHGLWGMGRPPVEIVVPADAGRLSIRGVPVHRTRVLHPADIHLVKAVPVTNPVRTVIDWCRDLHPAKLGWLLDHGISQGSFSAGEILQRIDELGARGWSGVAALRVALEPRLDAVAGRGDSGGELALARLLRDAFGLEAHLGYLVFDDTGVCLAEADLALPWAFLDLEYDGEFTHDPRLDGERDRRMTALGWMTLRATKYTLKAPDQFLDQVERRLREFGWRPDGSAAPTAAPAATATTSRSV